MSYSARATSVRTILGDKKMNAVSRAAYAGIELVKNGMHPEAALGYASDTINAHLLTRREKQKIRVGLALELAATAEREEQAA